MWDKSHLQAPVLSSTGSVSILHHSAVTPTARQQSTEWGHVDAGRRHWEEVGRRLVGGMVGTLPVLLKGTKQINISFTVTQKVSKWRAPMAGLLFLLGARGQKTCSPKKPSAVAYSSSVSHGSHFGAAGTLELGCKTVTEIGGLPAYVNNKF